MPIEYRTAKETHKQKHENGTTMMSVEIAYFRPANTFLNSGLGLMLERKDILQI